MQLSTPGVHFRQPAPITALRAVRADIAGFVGLAQRGPVDQPLPVASLKEFTYHFGPPVPWAYLGDAVTGFFANGGIRCHVVRVADLNALRRQEYQVRERGRTVFALEAIDPGQWASELVVEGNDAFVLAISSSNQQRDRS